MTGHLRPPVRSSSAALCAGDPPSEGDMHHRKDPKGRRQIHDAAVLSTYVMYNQNLVGVRLPERVGVVKVVYGASERASAQLFASPAAER